MTFGIKLHVWGNYACFTRPEMKAERVSYDVITPSAARGILEAIHWKPAISWTIDRIEVLKPIRFQSLLRNELASKIPVAKAKSAMRSGDFSNLGQYIESDRQQRATLVLTDVAYVIHAHFEMTSKAGPDDNPAKHHNMFTRRAADGQCFHRPCLGVREFPANFVLVAGDSPQSSLPEADRNRDLGWMLYDIDFANEKTSHFFRAVLKDGIIDLTDRRPDAFAS